MDGASSSQGAEPGPDAPRSFEYIDYATFQRERFDPTLPTTRLCLCHQTHSYPNLAVNQVIQERDDLLRDCVDHVADSVAAEEHITYLNDSLLQAYATIEQVQDESRQAHETAQWALEEMHRAQEEIGHLRYDHAYVVHRLGATERRLQEVGAMEEPHASQGSVNQEVAGGFGAPVAEWVPNQEVAGVPGARIEDGMLHQEVAGGSGAHLDTGVPYQEVAGGAGYFMEDWWVSSAAEQEVPVAGEDAAGPEDPEEDPEEEPTPEQSRSPSGPL